MADHQNPQTGRFVAAETAKPGVRVVRFARSDLGIELHAMTAPDDQPPFQEIRSFALDGLTEGDTLVLNLAPVEMFPSPFYRILLRVREVALEKKAKLVLCGASANVRRCFDVYKADKLFTFQPDEERAVAEA